MPVIPIKPTTSNEVKTEYTPKFQGTDVRITSEDYDSYKAYTGKVMPNTDLDYLRAVNQSVFEKVQRGTTNMIANIPIKLVEDIGYVADFFGDNNFDNDIIKFAKSIANPAGESYRINPDKVWDFSDPSWYANTIGQLGTSIGEFMVLSPTIGLGIGKVAGMIPKALQTAGKGYTAVKTGIQAKNLTQILGTALATSYFEGAQIAYERKGEFYNNIYAKNVAVNENKKRNGDEGLTDDEIKALSEQQTTEALRTVAYTNAMLVAPLNITGVKSILKPSSMLSFKKTAEQINKARPKGTTLKGYLDYIVNANPAFKTTPLYKRFVIEGSQEAIEEGIMNRVAEFRGEQQALNQYEDLGSQIFSEEGLLDATLGFIGGIGNTALTQAIPLYRKRDEKGNKVGTFWNRESAYARESRIKLKQQKDYFELMQKDAKSVQDIITKLEKTDNNSERTQLQNDLFAIMNKNTIQYGDPTVLLNIYDAVMNLDNTKPVETKEAIDADGNVQKVEYTEAMKAGFAFDQNDNEYAWKARNAKLQTVILAEKYDELYTKYHLLDEDTANSGIVKRLYLLHQVAMLSPDNITEAEFAYNNLLNDIETNNPNFKKDLISKIISVQSIQNLNNNLEKQLFEDSEKIKNNTDIAAIKERWNLNNVDNDLLEDELNNAYELRRKEYNNTLQTLSAELQTEFGKDGKIDIDNHNKNIKEHNSIVKNHIKIKNKYDKALKSKLKLENELLYITDKRTKKALDLKRQITSLNNIINTDNLKLINSYKIYEESLNKINEVQNLYDEFIKRQIPDLQTKHLLNSFAENIALKKEQLKEAKELLTKMDNPKYVNKYIKEWRNNFDNWIEKTETEQYKTFITRLNNLTPSSHFFLRGIEELRNDFPAYSHIIDNYLASRNKIEFDNKSFQDSINKIDTKDIVAEIKAVEKQINKEVAATPKTETVTNTDTKAIDDKIETDVFKNLNDIVLEVFNKFYQIKLNTVLNSLGNFTLPNDMTEATINKSINELKKLLNYDDNVEALFQPLIIIYAFNNSLMNVEDVGSQEMLLNTYTKLKDALNSILRFKANPVLQIFYDKAVNNINILNDKLKIVEEQPETSTKDIEKVEIPNELPPPPANLVNDGNGNLTVIDDSKDIEKVEVKEDVKTEVNTELENKKANIEIKSVSESFNNLLDRLKDKKNISNILYQTGLFSRVQDDALIKGELYFIQRTSNDLSSDIYEYPVIFKGEFIKVHVSGADGQGFDTQIPVIYTLDGKEKRLNMHTEQLVKSEIDDFSKKEILTYWIKKLQETKRINSILKLHKKDDGIIGTLINYDKAKKEDTSFVFKYYDSDFNIQEFSGIKKTYSSMYELEVQIIKTLIEKYSNELKALEVVEQKPKPLFDDNADIVTETKKQPKPVIVKNDQNIGVKIVDGAISIAYLNVEASKVYKDDKGNYIYVSDKKDVTFSPHYSMFNLQSDSELRFSLDKNDIKTNDGTILKYDSLKNNVDKVPIKIESFIDGKWVKVGYLHTTDWIKTLGSNGEANNVAHTLQVGDQLFNNYEHQSNEIKDIRNKLFTLFQSNDYVFTNVNAKSRGFFSFNKSTTLNKKGTPELIYTPVKDVVTSDMPVFIGLFVNNTILNNTSSEFNINSYIIDKYQSKKDLTEYESYLLKEALNNGLEISTNYSDVELSQFNGNPVLIIPTPEKNKFDFVVLRNDNVGNTMLKDKPLLDNIYNLFDLFLNNDLVGINKLFKNAGISEIGNVNEFFNIINKMVKLPDDVKMFFKHENDKKYISITIQPTDNIFKRVIISPTEINVYNHTSKESQLTIKINNLSEDLNKVLKAELSNFKVLTKTSNLTSKELNIPFVTKTDGKFKVENIKTGFDFYSDVLKSPLNKPSIDKNTGEVSFYEHPNILFNKDFRIPNEIKTDIPEVKEEVVEDKLTPNDIVETDNTLSSEEADMFNNFSPALQSTPKKEIEISSELIDNNDNTDTETINNTVSIEEIEKHKNKCIKK